VENLSVIILIMIGLVVIFIISSTVKILFHRRKAEIETLKLLGATKGFIRVSFLIEGGIIGLLGGVLATIGTWALYFMLLSTLEAYIPVMKTLIMPLQTVIALPLLGMLMGIAASMISVGRIKL
jgi:cell division transport system permease protein